MRAQAVRRQREGLCVRVQARGPEHAQKARQRIDRVLRIGLGLVVAPNLALDARLGSVRGRDATQFGFVTVRPGGQARQFAAIGEKAFGRPRESDHFKLVQGRQPITAFEARCRRVVVAVQVDEDRAVALEQRQQGPQRVVIVDVGIVLRHRPAGASGCAFDLGQRQTRRTRREAALESRLVGRVPQPAIRENEHDGLPRNKTPVFREPRIGPSAMLGKTGRGQASRLSRPSSR